MFLCVFLCYRSSNTVESLHLFLPSKIIGFESKGFFIIGNPGALWPVVFDLRSAKNQWSDSTDIGCRTCKTFQLFYSLVPFLGGIILFCIISSSCIQISHMCDMHEVFYSVETNC